jgi:hypothetical protein
MGLGATINAYRKNIGATFFLPLLPLCLNRSEAQVALSGPSLVVPIRYSNIPPVSLQVPACKLTRLGHE